MINIIYLINIDTTNEDADKEIEEIDKAYETIKNIKFNKD